VEIPQIAIPEIPKIKIQTYIPTTNESLNIALPKIDMAGCTKTHRDASVKNTQIISDDPNGAYYSCPAGHTIPSYIPINYDPKKLEYIEESKPESINTPPPPPRENPEIPPNKKEDIVFFTDCPDPSSNRRIGDYANDKKLERIVSFERNSEGVCQAIYEPVPFQEQYIPPVSLIINTFVVGLVAGGSAVLVPIIQGLAKTSMKKLGKKFIKETNQD
tara:strand:+ start:409 stop:1059 length:651 start_codon:yes stop_codon:yes gene_type:complete